jgi:hypothetical protein
MVRGLFETLALLGDLMHIELLVEELSMKVTLNILVPKIIGLQHSFEIYNFQNKKILGKII